jgi:hypothetical protein
MLNFMFNLIDGFIKVGIFSCYEKVFKFILVKCDDFTFSNEGY